MGGEASGAADELGGADESSSDGGGGLNGGEEVACALRVGAEAGFSGRFFVHLGAGGEVEDDVGGEGLVEAEEMDASATGQDEAAAETAACAAVEDFGADEAEERDGEVAEKAF